MPRISLVRQRRKEGQVVSHVALVDIDHIFPGIIDRRDHIKRRAQVLFHLLRHIFDFQFCGGRLGKSLANPLFQMGQYEFRALLANGSRCFLCLSVTDAHDLLHGFQVIRDLPPRQVFHFLHGAVRACGLLHEQLIVFLPLGQINKPLFILSAALHVFYE